jgi:hypothetical protein
MIKDIHLGRIRAPANKAVAPTAVKLGACGISLLRIPARTSPRIKLIEINFFTPVQITGLNNA